MLTLAPNEPVPVATTLVVFKLPVLALPDILNEVSVPMLVIFG